MSQFLSTQKVATTIDNKINKIEACAIGLPLFTNYRIFLMTKHLKRKKINYSTKHPIMAIKLYASFTANMHKHGQSAGASPQTHVQDKYAAIC